MFTPNSLGIVWEPFVTPSLQAMGVTGQHAFIVYTDADGVSHVLEHGNPYFAYDGSGTQYAGEWNDFLRYRVGTLDTSNTYPHPAGTVDGMDSQGVIYKSTSDFPNWTPSSTYFEIEIDDAQLATTWNAMVEHATAIKDSKIPYTWGLQGPVSNSVVASILADSGFDLETISGVEMPYDVSLATAAASVMSGKMSLATLGYGGIANTLPSVLSSGTYTSTVLVNAGVLGDSPVLLKDLKETLAFQNGVMTSHTFEAYGNTYQYADIDSSIITVLRNGEFTAEFLSEISDYSAGLASLSYEDAIGLVGVTGIDQALLTVAGIDGSYIS